MPGSTFARLALVGVVLATVPLASRAGDPPRSRTERFEAARQALLAEAADLAVTGRTVGRGAEPGRFYLLVTELERTGEAKEDYLALVRHEQVVVRAAGLICLARRFPAHAFDVLDARRSSETPLAFNPNGCTVETITEGELVARLLKDVDLLEGGLRPQPRPLPRPAR
ncbi:MAG: hypothetical protein M9894_39370 [Planctomycetes bacterium]|nr:hypothetical protein [Planctomycetota bacterium]